MKKLLILAASAAAILSACDDNNADDSGYTQVQDVTVWGYDCGNDVLMNWEFKEGTKGRYIINSGSILTPLSEDAMDRNFKRQDGTIFMVTGGAEAWTLKNTTTDTSTNCKRVIDRYYF